MPANVESMFYAGEVPWHGLGRSVQNELTAQEAIVKSGLDWEVGKAPLLANINNTGSAITFQVPVEDQFAVYRQTDNSILGIVGSRYEPIQNASAFDFFDGVVGEGKAIYHTAGSLYSGKAVWILAKMPNDLIIGKNDRVEKYLLLVNYHDGSGTLKMLATPTRVVCSNTMNMALKGSNIHNTISVRHTVNAPIRMAEAEKMLAQAYKFYEMFNEQAQALARFNYRPYQLAELVSKLFPEDDNGKLSKQAEHKREKIVELFDTGLGNSEPDIKGTAWASLNAVVQFADFNQTLRGGNSEVKMNKGLHNIWFGSAVDLKQQAFDIISQQMGM